MSPRIPGLDRLFKPSDRPLSIYEHIQAHVPITGPGLIEGGDKLPDDTTLEGSLRWIPGGLDGAFSRHVGQGALEDPRPILNALQSAASRGERQYRALESRLRGDEALSVVDPLLEGVVAQRTFGPDLEHVALRLATTSAFRNPVKIAIAVLGVVSDGHHRDVLTTLGRHEEFTSFVAVALAHSEPTASATERAQYELAQLVQGWGRIELVDRLRETTDPEIQNWILRTGFRNHVMDEYLAYVAATTGRLVPALEVDELDDELLDAACDIISALIMGGPAEDLSDYADGPRAIELLVGHLERRATTLHHLLAIHDIERLIGDDDRWTRRAGDEVWPAGARERVAEQCREILGRRHWAELAAAGLQSPDHQTFFEAERAARLLGLDVFDVHMRRLRTDPGSESWYSVMNVVDADRVRAVIDLAMRTLPLESIATGSANELGLGPEYRAHMNLTFVVQGLKPFPGKGWPLMAVALQSPVTNNRNMVLNVLDVWDRADWPLEVEPALRRAGAIEPSDQVRERIEGLLAGPRGLGAPDGVG